MSIIVSFTFVLNGRKVSPTLGSEFTSKLRIAQVSLATAIGCFMDLAILNCPKKGQMPASSAPSFFNLTLQKTEESAEQ